mgnify:CR=1 FL=1
MGGIWAATATRNCSKRTQHGAEELRILLDPDPGVLCAQRSPEYLAQRPHTRQSLHTPPARTTALCRWIPRHACVWLVVAGCGWLCRTCHYMLRPMLSSPALPGAMAIRPFLCDSTTNRGPACRCL